MRRSGESAHESSSSEGATSRRVADRASGWALVASLCLHVALGAWFAYAGDARAAGREPAPRPDAWVGDTVDIEDLVTRVDERRSLDPSPPPPNVGERPPRPPEERDEPRRAAPADAGPRPVASSTPLPSDGASRNGAERTSGAKGLPPGVRHLARAFTRALPIAAYHDATWARASPGPAGSVRVTIRVGRGGRVDDSEVHQPVERSLERLVERTLRHLAVGRFALTQGDGSAGAERLLVEVTLSDREPSEVRGSDPAVGVRYGFEPPKPGSPGRGYFTLGSGRHFDAKVTIESSSPLDRD